ncbi:HNH endonuclease [Maricaulis virginensis]|uniref:HNH nuclease domain-containing protein n=1 Tax=Maricaulis virginensis TaxID=144022 RepID=A0A9W6IKU6_9PROT|nr:HNH endonuclease [Maricaulis virginensis]GLK51349.1 hypothetical protein GCM10017621_08570 [Maricaulis virginensis]
MLRPNSRPDDVAWLMAELGPEDIEGAIDEYWQSDNKKVWLGNLRSGPSRRYFLYDNGEHLDAKAIVKAALVRKGYDASEVYEWHTDPLIDVLEKLGFPVIDEKASEAVDTYSMRRYESVLRLARQGQSRFRQQALEIWKGKCAISGVAHEQALEAAHVSPHSQYGQMTRKNSIILRVDLHRLFDIGMIAVDPEDIKVKVNPILESYQEFDGRSIALPDSGPSPEQFTDRWSQFLALQNK